MFQNNPYILNPQMNGGINNPYVGLNPAGYQQPNYYSNMFNNQSSQYSSNNLNEVISGSIVDSEDVVKSKNCSLDGSATYYPLSDKSAIYVKQLNPQTGAGMMLKYKLFIEDEKETDNIENQYITLLSEFKEDISKEINELKGLVLNQQNQPSTTTSKPRSITGGK